MEEMEGREKRPYVKLEEALEELRRLRESYGRMCDYLGIDKEHCDRKLRKWLLQMRRYIKIIERAMKAEAEGYGGGEA